MQGLPIQNLMKSPVKGENNAKALSSSLKGMNSSKEVGDGIVTNGETNLAAVKGNIDFASLLNGAKEEKSENGKNALLNIGVEKSEKSDNSEKSKEAAEVLLGTKGLENSIAKTHSSLDQLLNNLKDTSDVDAESVDGLENNSGLKKLHLPENLEKGEVKKDSPLDFLVKESKENKVSSSEDKLNNVELADTDKTAKRDFFPNQAKIPNNILNNKLEADSKLISKENLKIVSGEDFVDAKKNVIDSKNTDIKKLLGEKNIPNDNFDPSKLRGKDAAQIKGYQQGQNVLNDSMIRTNKDLAFKEQKKGKLSSIDELLTPESKVGANLASIKDAPIPLMAAKLGDNGIASKASGDTKVLDLSTIRTTNTNEIINKISDYVMQSNVASKDQIDLTVKHDSLGQFQIQVTKNPTVAAPHQVDMQIMTNSSEGHKFFVENESALMKSLQQSGVSLSDLRIVSTMTEIAPNSFSESKQFNSFGHNQNGSFSSSQQFESFQSGDYRQGSEKRKDLWNEYRERYGA